MFKAFYTNKTKNTTIINFKQSIKEYFKNDYYEYNNYYNKNYINNKQTIAKFNENFIVINFFNVFIVNIICQQYKINFFF